MVLLYVAYDIEYVKYSYCSILSFNLLIYSELFSQIIFFTEAKFGKLTLSSVTHISLHRRDLKLLAVFWERIDFTFSSSSREKTVSLYVLFSAYIYWFSFNVSSRLTRPSWQCCATYLLPRCERETREHSILRSKAEDRTSTYFGNQLQAAMMTRTFSAF